jgi:hypothetical protein
VRIVFDESQSPADLSIVRARAIAAAQHDAISFGQAVGEAGMSPSAVSRMGAGGWVRALPGVYLTGPGSTDQSLMAALLWAGPQGVLSNCAAAYVHALEGFDEAGAELTLPVECSNKNPRVVVHRANVPSRDRMAVRGSAS